MLTLKTYAFKRKFLKFIFSFLLTVSFSLSSEDYYRLGLGSCHDQDMETPAWESLKKENLDSFFFLGDNVYGDIPSGELRRLINAYETFKQNKPVIKIIVIFSFQRSFIKFPKLISWSESII